VPSIGMVFFYKGHLLQNVSPGGIWDYKTRQNLLEEGFKFTVFPHDFHVHEHFDTHYKFS